MSRKNLFVLFPMGLILIVCLFVAIRSQVKDRQVKDRQVSVSYLASTNAAEAKASQADNNQSTQQHAIKSPTGRHLVSYGPYDPYKAQPEPLLFTVVDTAEKTEVSIAIEWEARYVSSVEWIDDRSVLARGEGAFLAIIELASRKQTHSLIGHSFTIAPNNEALVYRYDFNPLKGKISPYRQSDYVLLTYLGDSLASRSPKDNYRVVYPEYLNWGVPPEKLYPEPDTRHHVVSAFAWSTDGKKIAFAENNEQALWLTVLTLNTLDDMRLIPHRFKLDVEKNEPVDVSWLSLSKIRVISGSTLWIIDVDSKSVIPRS
jgi:hypothetical protein